MASAAALDEDSSDPLSYYSQVLVEARSHAATNSAHQSNPQHPQHGPARSPPPSLGRQARDTTSGGGGHHHKSWASKLLSFLKRPNKKRHHEAKVIPVQDAASNKARSTTKYKSAPLQHQPGRQQQQQQQRQQPTSGPLYTDGTPLTPSHPRSSSKPKSGPLLDAFQLPNAAESPYVPLRRCGINSRVYSGPVYQS